MSIQQALEVVERGQACLPDPETTQVDANFNLGRQSIEIKL